jgi:hypothetical protein
VIDNPPLPVGRWWALERLPDGRPFMWAGPDAELWLPPCPAGTLVGLELKPAPGELPLEVIVGHGGGRFVLDGRAPPTRIWTRTTTQAADEPLVVELRRGAGYPPGGADERPLAAQLLGVVVRPPGARWGGNAATAEERAGLRLELDGGHGPESFGELGRGVWLEPEARLRMAVDEPGTLELRLAAPRPTPARPRLLVGGVEAASLPELDHSAAVISVPVDAVAVAAGLLELEIASEPYRPADAGAADPRTLGVVLLGVAFEPARPSEGWWNVR